MGTKVVDCKSYLTGYNSNYQYHNSMRDLKEDSSSSSWSACYGDNNTTTNGPYYYGFGPRASVADGYGKDALKQKRLEHEAVFKNQNDMVEIIDNKPLPGNIKCLDRYGDISVDLLNEVKKEVARRARENASIEHEVLKQG